MTIDQYSTLPAEFVQDKVLFCHVNLFSWLVIWNVSALFCSILTTCNSFCFYQVYNLSLLLVADFAAVQFSLTQTKYICFFCRCATLLSSLFLYIGNFNLVLTNSLHSGFHFSSSFSSLKTTSSMV